MTSKGSQQINSENTFVGKLSGRQYLKSIIQRVIYINREKRKLNPKKYVKLPPLGERKKSSLKDTSRHIDGNMNKWTVQYSMTGEPYYFNAEKNESQWTLPEGAIAVPVHLPAGEHTDSFHVESASSAALEQEPDIGIYEDIQPEEEDEIFRLEESNEYLRMDNVRLKEIVKVLSSLASFAISNPATSFIIRSHLLKLKENDRVYADHLTFYSQEELGFAQKVFPVSVASESELFDLLCRGLRDRNVESSSVVIDSTIPFDDHQLPSTAASVRLTSPKTGNPQSVSEFLNAEPPTRLVKPPMIRIDSWGTSPQNIPSPKKKNIAKAPSGWEKTPTGRPYYLNSRPSTIDDSTNRDFIENRQNVSPSPTAMVIRPKTAGAGTQPKVMRVGSKVSIEYSHEPFETLKSPLLTKEPATSPYTEDQTPYNITKEYYRNIEQKELRRISSAKVRRSLQEQKEFNDEKLKRTVRKETVPIAVDNYEAKKYEKSSFDVYAGATNTFQSSKFGLSPLQKEVKVRNKQAERFFDQSLELFNRTTSSPFENHENSYQKGYPLLPPKNFISEGAKRIQRDEANARNLVIQVENNTMDKTKIVSKAIYDARASVSGKREFLHRPLSATELKLATSPLLRNASSKNVMRL